MEGASEEEIKFLNTATFSKDAPFDEDSVKVEISLDKMQILKVGTSKIFGKIVTELVAKGIMIENFIPSEFHEKFKKYLAGLAPTNESGVTQNFIFKNEAGEIWVIEIAGQTAGTTYNLSFTDKTFTVAKLLGKDGGTKHEEEKVAEKKPVDLIYFRTTSVPDGDVKKWVTKTATLLTKVNLWPTENRTKFIAIRYEDDPREKAEYNHPFVDDLFCLPFDRLIFLQKTEIALNVPKKNSPSFLFVQKANDDIEIAKKVFLEKSNDLGFAIANPTPLASGTIGHIYFQLPGQKPLLDMYGKVHMNTPHPVTRGKHLSHFNFFGMTRAMNKEIKNYLARDSAYKNLVSQNTDEFKYNEENIFLTEEQKQKKTIVILDVDDSVVKNTVDYIKGEIHNIDVVSSDSYYGFFKKYLEKKADDAKATPATRKDFYADIVSILVSTVDFNLQMTMTPPSEEDRLFGHEAKKIFSEQQGWLSLFEEDARNLLTECLYLVLTTKRIYKNFELSTADGQKRLVAIEFILEEQSNIVRMNIKPPDVKFPNKTHQLTKIDSLDCVIIDYALLPEDINALIAGMTGAAEKSGIRIPAGGPRVIVMVNENQKSNFNELIESKIYALIYKPLEVRRILYLTTQAIATPFSIYTEDNIGWKQDHIAAKISRPAKLVELSEFGAVLKGPQPLKPGTMIYLFKSIFQNAPEQNICVRVYHSEEDEAEPGQYLNSVIYFGITDSFLKFTRSFIRETYASTKTKEG